MHKILVAALLTLASGAVSADAGALIERARQLELAERPAWLRLGHYRAHRGGWRSTLDSDWWFLAAGGKTDPDAELAATIRAFFDAAPRAPRDAPAQCIYRARYAWLDAHLDLRGAGIVPLECPEYDRWRTALAVDSVALVFPDAYMNSPSSMFGHTLLRLDQHDAAGSTTLLSYAVNYAAQTDEANGLVFAVKGLTGLYPGEFDLQPYYEKVRDYSRVENRDLWSYPLALDSAAIDRLLDHLWELRGAVFAYYFFDENCSWQLLALLEAARPDLDLTGGFEFWAIPADTVRRLQQAGLLGDRDYRPSLRVRLDHRLAQLDVTEARAFRQLALGGAELAGVENAPPRSRARLYSLLHDWLYYGFRSGRLKRDAALPRARQALSRRARVTADDGFDAVPVPPHSPEQGHPTARLRLGWLLDGDDSRVLLGGRPAFHDLLDPLPGYVPGAQIDFLQLDLGVGPGGDLSLEQLRLIDILSLTPYTRLFPHWSWRVSTGLRRNPLDGGTAAWLDGGPGLAFGSELQVYGFLLNELRAQNRLARGWSWAWGGELGLLWQQARPLQLNVSLRALQREGGDRRDLGELALRQQFNLPGGLGLRLEFAHDWVEGRAALRGWVQKYL